MVLQGDMEVTFAGVVDIGTHSIGTEAIYVVDLFTTTCSIFCILVESYPILTLLPGSGSIDLMTSSELCPYLLD